MKAAEAQEAKLNVQLDSDALSAEATMAALKADCSVAKLDAEADGKLLKEQLVDRLTAARSQTKAEQLMIRCGLEERRLSHWRSREGTTRSSGRRSGPVASGYELKKDQVELLKVRAGLRR